ncbi:MAG: hydantoinase [Peptococcaceae bacterium BICA1-8]|nr:MAG: hydantoinase [Peptococcaceae bacterium BICA1-8]
MLIGIDIGGTSTDGVLLQEGKILSSAKCLTDETDLQRSIFTIIDELTQGVEKSNITRVALSTTLVTNILATGKGDKTALVLIPGPGLNLKNMQLFPHTFIIDGASDFRGRIIEPLNEEQVKKAGKLISDAGITKAAVVGKFSPRNSEHERRAKEILLKEYPKLEITVGFEISGQLNFLRRMATAYYTAMTQEKWAKFAVSIEKALRDRGINSPVSILKADGGTMPLSISLEHPCETVFSGPAASVMGAFALTMDEETSVVVDIGGTTTDLALILQGKPLYASKGAIIEGHYTSIRSFNMLSIALGGDSAVRLAGAQVTIGPDRVGLAACFGGPIATPTDAINFLEDGELGELHLSQEALEKIAAPLGISVKELAELIVNQFVDSVEENIKKMFKAWEEEPAYKVYEVVNKRSVQLDKVVGIGGAAKAFVPLISKRLGCRSLVHSYAQVANALGAAVARPTLSLILHADTQEKYYNLNFGGISGKIPSNFNLDSAKEMAKKHLEEIMAKRGLVQFANQSEFFLEEQFNTISGYSTTGKLFDIGIQIAPGVINEFREVRS